MNNIDEILSGMNDNIADALALISDVGQEMDGSQKHYLLELMSILRDMELDIVELRYGVRFLPQWE
jgi:hypothetical protein